MKKYMLLMVATLLFSVSYSSGSASSKTAVVTEVRSSQTPAGTATLIVSGASTELVLRTEPTPKAVVSPKYVILAAKKVLPKTVLLTGAAGYSIPLYKEYAERWYSSRTEEKTINEYLIARNKTTRCLLLS